MNWKVKAAIQNAVSLLPSSTSYSLYYWLQRRFGNLRYTNPTDRLQGGIGLWKRIVQASHNPRGKTFFELGTGWVANVPMTYWLMGAGEIRTIDVNPYMKAELTQESLQYIVDHESQIRALFGEFLVEQRFKQLLAFQRSGKFSLVSFLDMCNITYMAPGDGRSTGLEPKSIDYYATYGVLNHVPPTVLPAVLQEMSRITKDGGLFAHRIDYSDMFSHSDTSITAINFLQYSQAQWQKYAGNRYMYSNRLRHDDFVKLFESAGHRILIVDTDYDERCAELVRNHRIPLDPQFKDKSLETLAVRSAWFVMEKT